jgi:hypothetical protein
MKKFDRDAERDARLTRLSREKYGLDIQANWRRRSFFEFLQISPSYRLAHRVATGNVIDLRKEGGVPPDFLDVVKMYEAFGDVWRTDYWTWWVRRAQYHFGSRVTPQVHQLALLQPGKDSDEQIFHNACERLDQYLSSDREVEGKPGSLLLAIPLQENRNAILKAVSKQVDEALKALTSNQKGEKLEFVVNKVRFKTLDDARRVAWARAAMPKKPLYVIGNRVAIASAYVTDEKVKLRGDNRRDLMVIVTSRHLHRALVFSENAARGRFPSDADVVCTPFDYKELQAAIISHRNWMKTELTRLKHVQTMRIF